MLNQDALAQLRQLKQDIHDSKDRAEGIVKGSQGRFGFVTLEDGREIYLSPEQMQHVFPDDRIAVEVIAGNTANTGKTAAKGDKSSKGDKPSAHIERLIDSPLRAFTGRYIVRDNAHFVEPDLPRLSRWIFVPPKLRAGEKDNKRPKHGDLVKAHITQHPFKDGKPQARIETVIGNESQKGVEARYALARFDLPLSAPTLIDSDLAQPDPQTRRDLTALPLITIDGSETRDMDDALHAEQTQSEDGTPLWKLTVAIADPSAWIKAGSALEKTIAARGTSAYLPGLSVPMLPEQLANDRCSLLPEQERLALVCEIWIDRTGHIARHAFCEARVRSHAKLSYEQVADYLQAPDTLAPSAWSDSLRTLHAVSTSLQQQRQREHVALPERAEYRAQLDENGRVKGYLRQIKTAAHQLVEECMVAANRCAAHYLQQDSLVQADGQDPARAVFVTHAGFRSERRDNVAKLIAAELPQCAQRDVTQLADYIALMQTIATAQSELPLREILTRSLERSQFSATPAPHFGMGLECYTTITSPIRKFNDYLAQRAVKAKLRGEACAPITAEMIAQLQDCNDRTRQAVNFAQQWLDSDYLAKQPAQSWPGTIVHVTSSGFLVRLNDTGIQGLVDTRQSGEKMSFDSVYMRLKSATRSFQLDQQVEVTVAAIDTKKHQIAFALVPPVALAPSPAPVSRKENS